MRKGVMAVVLFWAAGTTMADINVDTLARTCNNCHGLNGVSAGATMPSIGGLPKGYLSKIMKEWKYDKRAAATMNRIVKGFSDDEIDALAAYFSKRRWLPVAQKTSAVQLKLGKSVIRENCEDCHGTYGNDPDIDAPRIDGQSTEYMALELEKYRDEAFDMPHRKMKKTIRRLKDGEVTPVVDYYGAQKR
ncbi:MAG: c-type cytochrome [Gallionellaceae bacterium]|nr:c-type cytochrome [Gallionellaceae bacterium]MDD5366190.1 c-type cytochrome [Gallionellaceae bacterium]